MDGAGSEQGAQPAFDRVFGGKITERLNSVSRTSFLSKKIDNLKEIEVEGRLSFLYCAVFLCKKMMENAEMITEAKLVSELRERPDVFPPLHIRVLEDARGRDIEQAGILVEAAWGGKQWRFAAEIKRLATPRILDTAIRQARAAADRVGIEPLVVVPYLSDRQLENLTERSMNGIDLCGNGVIEVPGELFVRRSGGRNLYPASTPIRKVYRGASSQVARVFLARPAFSSVGQVRAEILRRGGDVALSTVSRVLKVLCEDLVIRRDGTSSFLIQPDELLDRLAANFVAPPVTRTLTARWVSDLDPGRAITEAGATARVNTVMTGAGSAGRFAVMAREGVASFYCTDTRALAGALEDKLESATRFAVVELFETDEKSVYFDRHLEDGVAIASPLQCWLELQAGDKRERQAAEQVRKRILAALTALSRETRS